MKEDEIQGILGFGPHSIRSIFDSFTPSTRSSYTCLQHMRFVPTFPISPDLPNSDVHVANLPSIPDIPAKLIQHPAYHVVSSCSSDWPGHEPQRICLGYSVTHATLPFLAGCSELLLQCNRNGGLVCALPVVDVGVTYAKLSLTGEAS